MRYGAQIPRAVLPRLARQHQEGQAVRGHRFARLFVIFKAVEQVAKCRPIYRRRV